MNLHKISEVMVPDVLKAKKTDTILDIAGRLHKHRMGAIVITDSSGSPIGIVTERDIIRGIIAYKETLLEKQAQDIMSAPLLTILPEDDIETAAALMTSNKIRRIPVVKDNRLYGIISYRDITNALRKSFFTLEQHAEEMTEKANRDSLTGLYNRGYIMEQLNYHMELAKRTSNTMTVIMMDIDHFKKINDTYGHLCGDYVLKKLAELLHEKSRAINIVGRYGGEEFIIIGPIGDDKSSAYFAERLRSEVESMKFSCGNRTFKLTISAGVAVWNPEITDTEHFIKLADDALYDAKNSGRNRVKIAET